MIGYAVRVLPWRLTLASCALITALMSLVAAWPWVMWPLQGTSVGLIAGAVAWAMDERAAAVVDTLPRSLRWRTTARALIVVPLLGVWIVALVLMRDRIPAHLDLFILQGSLPSQWRLPSPSGAGRTGSPNRGVPSLCSRWPPRLRLLLSVRYRTGYRCSPSGRVTTGHLAMASGWPLSQHHSQPWSAI